MAGIPGFLLTETVTVEPYEGVGPTGPVFGTALSLRAHVQEEDTLPPRAPRTESAVYAPNQTLTYRVWLRLGPTIPVGSRITVRGVTATAAAVDVNDGQGLPTPSHIEILCERHEFLANALVTITRGTPTLDAWGDPVDSTTVIASAVQASIVEDTQVRYGPADQRGGVIEAFDIRLRSTASVLEGDRIEDERTGQVFQVTSVRIPQSSVGSALGTDDVQVLARRVAATSHPNT